MEILRYLIFRIISFLGVILFGITLVFFIPRLSPNDPVQNYLNAILSGQGGGIDGEAIQEMRVNLTILFGLEDDYIIQYFRFIFKFFLTGDFGPSFSAYPTTVNTLISHALPWTLGLLLFSTIIAWVIGNIVVLIVGFKQGKLYSTFLELIAIVLYPIPYYILGLILLIFFGFVFPIFPMNSTFLYKEISIDAILRLLEISAMPALSIIIISIGWWIISMKAMSLNIKNEEYVKYARLMGIKEYIVMFKYVLPNSLLPQITVLALQFGTIFSGAFLTEILFSYPGLGNLMYTSVLAGDYNLIVGTVTLSIIAVATATFIVDFIYPFVDPKIKYK